VPNGLSVTAANATLSALAGTYTWAQLHVGAPGANGTANVAAETDRVQVTWGAPSGGAMTNTAPVSWVGVAGTEDYTDISLWSAATLGTFGMSGLVTANAVTAGDTFTIPIGELDVALQTAS